MCQLVLHVLDVFDFIELHIWSCLSCSTEV